jgi:hypothetical protein
LEEIDWLEMFASAAFNLIQLPNLLPRFVTRTTRLRSVAPASVRRPHEILDIHW